MQNKRPPEPEFVTDWRNGKPPRCCYTCVNYTSAATCIKHGNEAVPEDFAATYGACESWDFDEIPF